MFISLVKQNLTIARMFFHKEMSKPQHFISILFCEFFKNIILFLSPCSCWTNNNFRFIFRGNPFNLLEGLIIISICLD